MRGKKETKINRKRKEKQSFDKGEKALVKDAKENIPLHHSIAIRLITAFLIPVLGVLFLGVMSYNKASNAIVDTYKESVQQTANTMQQYINLVITSEQDEFKNYLSASDLKKYFFGTLDEQGEKELRDSYQTKLRNKLAVDSKIEGVYILGNEGRTIDGKGKTWEHDLYNDYIATEQGALPGATEKSWFYFGVDQEVDQALDMNIASYGLRIVKKLKDQKAILMINFSDEYIRNAMKSLNPGEGGYVALITEQDGYEFYAEEKNTSSKSRIYGTKFYNNALSGKQSSGNQMVEYNGKQYMFVYSKLTTGNLMLTALIPSDRLLEQSSGIKQLTTILVIFCIILALALGIIISKQMTGTIKYILRQLRKVANGDLTIHLIAKRRDEFALLCDGINDTVEHVKSLITDVNDVSTQVSTAAERVASTSGTFMATSQNIQNAVIEIEKGVQKLDSNSDNCMSQMDSLSDKIINVSSNADEIGKLTNATSQTIASGICSVQSLTKSAYSTAEITRSVIDSIEELEGKSKSIGHIVSAINDIAEQTNLLSLNASIEAARAGEVGRGFSVVAEEIRKLADQCLTSAAQISVIVNEIVGKTGEVVKIAKQAETVVETQSAVVEDTTNSFRQIDQLAEQLVQALETISNNVQEIGGARNETMNAIASISDASTKTAACSDSVHTATGTQIAAIKELNEASQSLTAKAENLIEALGTFQI